VATEEDNVVLRSILAAHELLLGAEVQSYVKSAAGKTALKQFHRKAREG
jgi:hypothetical protein